ncbi:YvrJ family protein [uncultured Clostridium sp.]|jgi:hypothetical protein|nr:YvrJ family protein [uncultured Clostridium sp.]
MENLIDLIANVGFPIATTMYLLMRIEVKLDRLSVSIEKLCNVLNKN